VKKRGGGLCRPHANTQIEPDIDQEQLGMTLFALGRALFLSLVASQTAIVEGILYRGCGSVRTMAIKAALDFLFCLGSMVALEAIKGLGMHGMIEINSTFLFFSLVDHDLCRGISSHGHGSRKSHGNGKCDKDNSQFSTHEITS
jgi:hypothetical protein